jgi:predicted PurR-regulated permease PerM
MEKRKMVISRRKRSLIFLFIVLAALLPLLLQIVRPFLTAFILAAILAIVIHPIKELLHRWLRHPGLATFVTTFASVARLGVLLAFAGIRITSELEEFYRELSLNSLEEGGWPALAATAADHIVDKLSEHFPIDEEAARMSLLNGMKTSSLYLLSHIGPAVSGVTSFFFSGALMTIFLYFLLRYGSIWAQKLVKLTLFDQPVIANIFKTIQDSVAANVNGMLAVIAGQGVLLIFVFWITGVRSPVFWGITGGFASVIPLFGATLIWVPVAIGFLFIGAYGKALFLAVWGIVVVGASDNVLRSIIVGKQEKQHPVLIALAALGGVYAFGVLGIMLGPLAITLAAALIKEIYQISVNAGEENVAGIPPPDAEKMSPYSENVLRLLLARRKYRYR